MRLTIQAVVTSATQVIGSSNWYKQECIPVECVPSPAVAIPLAMHTCPLTMQTPCHTCPLTIPGPFCHAHLPNRACPPWEQNHRCKKNYLSATTVADSKYSHVTKCEVKSLTRKHSSRMRTDRAITMMTNDRAAMWPIVDRQTPVKTLPSLTVGNN